MKSQSKSTNDMTSENKEKKNEDLCLDAHIEARSKPTFSRLETFTGQASQWSWLLVLCYITQDILKWCHVFSYQSTLISSTFLCFPFLFWKEEMFFSSLFYSWLKYLLYKMGYVSKLRHRETK